MSSSSSSQPLRVCWPAMQLRPKDVSNRLIGLAEVLLSRGDVEEAVAVAKAALRGFVTFADQNSKLSDDFPLFLSAVEYFASSACQESPQMQNSLIRLYGRLLHLQQAAMHDWDEIEHPILRSCVLHGISGGSSSAYADLSRKSKLWKINPDSSYVEKAKHNRPKDEMSDDGSDPWMSDEETPQESEEQVPLYQPRPNQARTRGVVPHMVANRQSPTIAHWLDALSK